MAVVDRSRELWFDVMTQFRAAFTTRRPAFDANAAARVKAATASTANGGAEEDGDDDDDDSVETLLSAWVALRVRELHATISHCLPHIRDLAEVSRALDQCM